MALFVTPRANATIETKTQKRPHEHMRRKTDRPFTSALLLGAFLDRGSDGCLIRSWNTRRQHLYKLSARRAISQIICENMIELIDSGEVTVAQLNNPRSVLMVRSCMNIIRAIVDEVKREVGDKTLRLRLAGPRQTLAGVRGVGLICDAAAWNHVEKAIRRMQSSEIISMPSPHSQAR